MIGADIRSRLMAVALGLGASLAFAGAAVASPGAPIPRNPTGRHDVRGQRQGGFGWVPRPSRYPKNTGWTNASYRRAAAKRRRVLANRRAHRG